MKLIRRRLFTRTKKFYTQDVGLPGIKKAGRFASGSGLKL